MDSELLRERFPDSVFFREEWYDEAILGVSTNGRVVYSYEGLVKVLMEHDGMDYEEAEDWIDFNMAGSVVAEGNLPVIVYTDLE